MKKILITGGAGYIGCSLAEQLSQQADVEKVIVYDNLSKKNYSLFTDHRINGKKVEFIQGTILDNHTLAKAMEGCSVVYHLAAMVITPDSDNDSQYFEQVNNWGTSIVVREAEKAGVETFVYLSTVYVYGQGPETKTTEHTVAPNSFYSTSKLRGEEHVKTLPKNIKTYILRSGSVYGANASTRYDVIINQLLFETHFFKKVSITGQGHQVRPFIHIGKLTESLVQTRNSELPSGTYNLLEHNASILDVVEKLKEVYPDLEYNYVNRHMKMKDVIVEPSEEIQNHIPFSAKEFTEELKEFKNQLW